MGNIDTFKPIVNPYLEKFKSTGGYFIEDDSVINFFSQHPKNTDPMDVLLKVEEVGHVFEMDRHQQDLMARHIRLLDIDDDLRAGSMEVVDKIADFNGNFSHSYSFATRYGNYHRQNHYPIYDLTIEDMLIWFYSAVVPARFDPEDLKNYPQLKKITDRFASEIGLSELNYWELDKFLWVYGRRIKEALQK